MFLGVSLSAAGQPDEREAIHWAYGSFLGTGWYRLGADREVFALNIPVRWQFRETVSARDGERQAGIEFHLPVTIGLHQFGRLGLGDIGDFLNPENVGTVSVNPGMEVEYPVTERWRLRGYAHLGWGTSTAGGDSAWIYDAGVKSRVAFSHGDLDWGVLNGLFMAGYNPEIDRSGSMGGFMGGLDFRYPLATRLGTDRPLDLTWDFAYRRMSDDLTFRERDGSAVSLDDEWEIGIALARRDGPIPFWFMEFEQVGLTYRFSGDGNFRAVTVNLSAPFSR